MKLEIKTRDYTCKEYYCDITRELDELANLSSEWFKHYILVCKNSNTNTGFDFIIRVPGGTLGAILLDENMVITKIIIDTNYVVKSYPKDVGKIINDKYVGTKIELEF